MRMRTTSTHRTYRYVRLSLVGVILFLAVGVGTQIFSGGVLVSVSAAFYTPARDVFVGALCAVSLALLALSGRSVEQVLLDLAALFAPVIALIPSPVETGVVSGVAVTCPGEQPCVPGEFLPGVSVAMVALLGIGITGLVAAVVLARVQGTLDTGAGIAFAAASGIVVAFGGWWLISPGTFVLGAHNVAALAFFALIAVVATLAAVRPGGSDPRRRRRLRAAYAAIAAGILLALSLVVVVVTAQAAGLDLIEVAPVPLFFVGEAVALALFAAFWVVQTVELWNQVDPRSLTRAEATP
jgi:hypothetical protein